MASQSFRTIGIQEGVIKIFKENNGIYISNTAPIICMLMSLNLSTSLFYQSPAPNIHLIENKTSLSFLTSDQPIINLDSQGDVVSPNRFSWYYPVTPKLAVLVTEDARYKNFYEGGLSVDKIDFLNKKIIFFKNKQIYASSKDIIERYCGGFCC